MRRHPHFTLRAIPFGTTDLAAILRRITRELNSLLPCRVQIHARNIGKNIDPARVTSKSVAVGEVFRANSLKRRAKFGKRGIRRAY